MKAVHMWCTVCKKITKSDESKIMDGFHHWCMECGEVCLVCGKKWPEQLPKRVKDGPRDVSQGP